MRTRKAGAERGKAADSRSVGTNASGGSAAAGEPRRDSRGIERAVEDFTGQRMAALDEQLAVLEKLLRPLQECSARPERSWRSRSPARSASRSAGRRKIKTGQTIKSS